MSKLIQRNTTIPTKKSQVKILCFNHIKITLAELHTVNEFYQKDKGTSVMPHNTVMPHKTTVDSCYLEIEGTLKNSLRYPYFDISDL